MGLSQGREDNRVFHVSGFTIQYSFNFGFCKQTDAVAIAMGKMRITNKFLKFTFFPHLKSMLR